MTSQTCQKNITKKKSLTCDDVVHLIDIIDNHNMPCVLHDSIKLKELLQLTNRMKNEIDHLVNNKSNKLSLIKKLSHVVGNTEGVKTMLKRILKIQTYLIYIKSKLQYEKDIIQKYGDDIEKYSDKILGSIDKKKHNDDISKLEVEMNRMTDITNSRAYMRGTKPVPNKRTLEYIDKINTLKQYILNSDNARKQYSKVRQNSPYDRNSPHHGMINMYDTYIHNYGLLLSNISSEFNDEYDLITEIITNYFILDSNINYFVLDDIIDDDIIDSYDENPSLSDDDSDDDSNDDSDDDSHDNDNYYKDIDIRDMLDATHIDECEKIMIRSRYRRYVERYCLSYNNYDEMITICNIHHNKQLSEGLCGYTKCYKSYDGCDERMKMIGGYASCSCGNGRAWIIDPSDNFRIYENYPCIEEEGFSMMSHDSYNYY